MSDSAIYRIWRRFLQAQSTIRTALTAMSPPPTTPTQGTFECAEQGTIAHLQEAFKDSPLNPIAAYQATTGSFFI